MAVDMFLKLDGIKGESTKTDHEDEIEVFAFSWGMSQSGDMHIGRGGGAGRVNVQDLSITKPLDVASTALMKKCCNGTHISEGLLTCREAGGDGGPVEYFKVTIEEIIITSVSHGGSGGQDQQTENVTLNFAKVKVAYTPQSGEGAGEGEAELGWNIRDNTEL